MSMPPPIPPPVKVGAGRGEPERIRLLTAREVVGLVLCLGGAASVTTAAFSFDWRWGLLALGAVTLLFGILLASER